MKKIAVTITVITILGLFLFFFMRNSKDVPKFKTEIVKCGEIKASVTATGTVNPVTTVDVGTQVSGTIKYIYVDFNSVVKKGELIAMIDPTLFEAQVEKAKANLDVGKANLEKAKATMIDARRTMERYRELFSKDLVARSDLDTAETNYETAKAQVAAYEAQIGQLEADLKYAKTNLKYTKILSPVNGVVVSRKVDVGQTVAASFQTPTLFTIAEDLTKMQIDTNIDEADIGSIAVGQDAEFTVDAYPELPFKGKVSEVRIAPTTIQNVVTYDVVIKVDNPELKLKPGMTANVSIITKSRKDVLMVPNTALRFKPPGLSGKKAGGQAVPKGPGVWVLDGNGRPVRIAITTGITDGTYTEVTSGRLKEGDMVITEAIDRSEEQKTQFATHMHF
ncbi:MAG: efflux RND transporter periplasmic adaptor subunit [Dissulfurimicrobium sp.]|uniref:efflux RND transporter periplasmic adaptor subunit n=1 Tax=Dissulfurimicrobium TaxID=1769732 RepID=UPI001EDA632F|nr:efflux RND transporter periplasmic adaptor subunit [Dissulfurimicrobium hydrothermale]UKL13223.1 efflux RND transporter periplasmic adaptor subunit [Dissulfurimicrobium hydrothermale]